jgi:hypothetical protein
MKKIILQSSLTILMVLGTSIFTAALADDPGPPPPPPNGGQGGNQPGGAAPLGNGITLLLALSAGYAGKKRYYFRSEKGK